MKDSTGRVALETLVVVGLRGAFFLVASRYLEAALFANLRQVIHDETSLNTSSMAANGSALNLNSGQVTPEDYCDSPTSGGPSFKDQLYNLRQAGSSSTSILPTTASSSHYHQAVAGGGGNNGTAPFARQSVSSPDRILPGSSSSISPSPANGAARRISGSTPSYGHSKRGSSAASSSPKLAGAVFCLSVSECLTLFALIMFGGVLGEDARLLNWNFSLGAVLLIIVVVAPLGICLLLAVRRKTTSKSLRRTAIFTLVPFLLYLFGLYEIGDFVAHLFGVEQGTHNPGLFSAALLDRVCVPGVVLIAALSGGYAVITAWDAFEWRERFRAEAVTDGHINAAARSLAQTRTDLAARQAEIDALNSASHDDQKSSFFSIFSSSPNAAKVKSLQAEIKGLEVMESQMSHDLQLMKKRKEIAELSQTWSGKALQALGWAFSVYCVYRVVTSLINLVFGSAFSGSGEGGRKSYTDVTSAVLSYLAEALGLDIDVHTWTKAIGLLLTGSIILVNINAVLGYVSRAFRATSAGVSASFMLLCLAQLLAVYLVTSLISLPSGTGSDDDQDDGSNAAAVLLDTLPDFRVFARLFDAVFLVTAAICFMLRYLQRKIRVDEHLGLQDFV